MIKRVLVMLSAVVILVSGAMFTVSAQDGPTPEQAAAAAADTRQALFKLFIFNLRPIAAMAQGAPLMRKLPREMPAASPPWQQ